VLLEEKIGNMLRQMGLRVALAESCTGGLISHRITNVAGASDYFDLGIVTYSNQAKEAFLAVPRDVIKKEGAVSHEVAGLMAEGVRKASGADIGLSVTGIAGPGGGRPGKPVGTVYIGLAASEKVFVKKFLFSGTRVEVKARSSDEALQMLRQYLEGGLR
jgi:PncC family amidohydrolase